MDLYKLTFHPDLDGMAFLGVFQVIGPNWPLLELQARWITYTWTGIRPKPTRDQMLEGVVAARRFRFPPRDMLMHAAAVAFSREIGTEPDIRHWPELARSLLFGPLSAISFRLSGPDALPEAPQRYAEDAKAFGCMTSCRLTDAQRGQLRNLAQASHNPALADLAEHLD
jgi:hypothetical protein